MKIEVHSFQAPRWIIPLLILAALALIPFALALAAGMAVLALGVGVLKLLLPSSGTSGHVGSFETRRSAGKFSDSTAIDADYEVKGENEKDQLH